MALLGMKDQGFAQFVVPDRFRWQWLSQGFRVVRKLDGFDHVERPTPINVARKVEPLNKTDPSVGNVQPAPKTRTRRRKRKAT